VSLQVEMAQIFVVALNPLVVKVLSKREEFEQAQL
jgi:hypothetical protein